MTTELTCRSCYNHCGESRHDGKVNINCRVLGWVPIRDLRECRETSAAREPGVDEADWEDE